MQLRRRFYFMLALMGILLLPLGVLFFQVKDLESALRAKRYSHVVFITIDTLRADYLGCYGDPRIKTPTIDSLVKQGLQFQDFSCQIPITNPSHCSLFTGLSPHEHGVLTNGVALPPTVETLPARFRAIGYQTAAFVSGFSLVSRISGLQAGFETYDDAWSKSQVERSCADTTDAVAAWLKSAKITPESKFFLWIHYFDPHQPYSPPQPFDELYIEEGFIRPPEPPLTKLQEYDANATTAKKAGFFHVLVKDTMTTKAEPVQVEWNKRRYAGEITAVDRELARLLTTLKERGLLMETIIVLTADHGEGFEHDYYFAHGDRLYDTALRVPCVIWVSDDKRPKLRPEPTQTLDIMPTFLAAFSILDETKFLGTNLFGGKTLPESQAMIELEGTTPALDRPTMSLGPLTSLRSGSWKLIHQERTGNNELYNLHDDPAELTNLWGRKPRIQNELSGRLSKRLANRPEREASQPLNLDEEVTARLRELGYIQ